MKDRKEFLIHAYINHNKSTLSDLLIQYSSLNNHKAQTQILDTMHNARERGITLKTQMVIK